MSLLFNFFLFTFFIIDKTLSESIEISCGMNEIASLCHNECEQTCNNTIFDVAVPYPCKNPCRPGCECVEDFVRDHNKVCVPVSQCSPVYCGDHESPVFNDNTCEQTCSGLLLGEEEPAPCLSNHPGCDCTKGYYRNHNNECVGEIVCSPCRGTNEEYHTCMLKCQLTCWHKYKPFCSIGTETCTKGCVCKKGFFRNIFSGFCVTREECFTITFD